MSSAQETMQRMLDAEVRRGPERGLQLTAIFDGVKVVDAWAGTADSAGTPVGPETLFPVFSTTKGIAATVIHLLAERGLLSYDAPIADVWPEFARHGKGRITLRQALCHESGIPLMPVGIGYAELCDWDKICAAVADLRLAYAPGRMMSYHAATFGWVLGEVARRVSGRSFSDLLEKEIKQPLGITDLYVGIPDAVESRVATVYESFAPGTEPPPPDDPTPRSLPGWMQPLGGMMNRPDARRACMPAVNGIANARSLARFYAALVPGGIDGVELLPPSRVRAATRQETLQHGLDLEWPRRMGLGYFMGGKGTPEMSLRLDCFGHGGYGSSLAYVDPSRRLSVGFTKNYLTPIEPVRTNVMRALRKALRLSET